MCVAGAVVGVLAAGGASVAAAEELRIAIGGGRVTLIADDAALGDVLAAWARAGGTRFAGAGPIEAARVSLHLVDCRRGAGAPLAAAASGRLRGHVACEERPRRIALRACGDPRRKRSAASARRARPTGGLGDGQTGIRARGATRPVRGGATRAVAATAPAEPRRRGGGRTGAAARVRRRAQAAHHAAPRHGGGVDTTRTAGAVKRTPSRRREYGGAGLLESCPGFVPSMGVFR